MTVGTLLKLTLNVTFFPTVTAGVSGSSSSESGSASRLVLRMALFGGMVSDCSPRRVRSIRFSSFSLSAQQLSIQKPLTLAS